MDDTELRGITRGVYSAIFSGLFVNVEIISNTRNRVTRVIGGSTIFAIVHLRSGKDPSTLQEK